MSTSKLSQAFDEESQRQFVLANHLIRKPELYTKRIDYRGVWAEPKVG